VAISATSAPFPGEAGAVTLPSLQLFQTLCLCLALCCLFVLGFSSPQFDLTRAPLFDRLTAYASGSNPHSAAELSAAPAPVSSGTLSGKITYDGTPKKYKPIDMSAEPNCAKFYTSSPMPEVSVTGPGNSLENVIVYISAGAPDENFSGAIAKLSQRGCRYNPHVVSVQTNQEVWVQNDDTVTHSVHPMAKANAEWNRSQPPGTPPVVIRYTQPEFIRVKCELHPWMRGVLAVFKNSHHAVTDGNGAFSLPNLPPGKYTVTAWHELYGEQSKEITVTAGDNKPLDFVFKVTPY
jgi:plastocyanin